MGNPIDEYIQVLDLNTGRAIKEAKDYESRLRLSLPILKPQDLKIIGKHRELKEFEIVFSEGSPHSQGPEFQLSAGGMNPSNFRIEILHLLNTYHQKLDYLLSALTSSDNLYKKSYWYKKLSRSDRLCLNWGLFNKQDLSARVKECQLLRLFFRIADEADVDNDLVDAVIWMSQLSHDPQGMFLGETQINFRQRIKEIIIRYEKYYRKGEKGENKVGEQPPVPNVYRTLEIAKLLSVEKELQRIQRLAKTKVGLDAKDPEKTDEGLVAVVKADDLESKLAQKDQALTLQTTMCEALTQKVRMLTEQIERIESDYKKDLRQYIDVEVIGWLERNNIRISLDDFPWVPAKWDQDQASEPDSRRSSIAGSEIEDKNSVDGGSPKSHRQQLLSSIPDTSSSDTLQDVALTPAATPSGKGPPPSDPIAQQIFGLPTTRLLPPLSESRLDIRSVSVGRRQHRSPLTGIRKFDRTNTLSAGMFPGSRDLNSVTIHVPGTKISEGQGVPPISVKVG